MSHCEIFDVRPAVAGMQASTPPPLAASATCATAGRAAVGSGVGAVRRPRSAWLSEHGSQAPGPAWPEPAAPPIHRPAGKPLEQT